MSNCLYAAKLKLYPLLGLQPQITIKVVYDQYSLPQIAIPSGLY